MVFWAYHAEGHSHEELVRGFRLPSLGSSHQYLRRCTARLQGALAGYELP
jgi:hypothetical protein